MITIAKAVKDTLSRSPFMMEAITEDIANYSKIARKIKPVVEALLYENVSEASVVMALHRLAQTLPAVSDGSHFLRGLQDVTVRSNLVEFVVPNVPALQKIQQEILQHADGKRDVFINISRGLHETIVVVSKNMAQLVEQSLGDIPTHHMENLSSVTLRLPQESLDVPGVYYPILKVLAREGINFVEIISVATELTIIFENKDVDRAFSTLKRITM